MPELADSLTEPFTQSLVFINPMAAGMADFQGAVGIEVEHGFK
jgi:hypothetical protein